MPILLAAILAGLLVFGANTLDPIGFTNPDRRNDILASPDGEWDGELVGVPQLGRPLLSGSSNFVILVTDAPIDDFDS